jgi:hypothetical protein
MVIRELINKSVYGTIGYISSYDGIDLFERYLQYNYDVLKEFKDIIIALNHNGDLQLVDLFVSKVKIHHPDCKILVLDENRGHNHGYADLDNMLFNYCKENNIEWLCKSANDTLLDKSLLDKQIGEADFYYLNGIGLGGMAKYDFDNERIIYEDFYPQTNFYFINVSKADYLNNQNYLDFTYNEIKSIPDYNGRVWEYFSGWSCEDFLKDCIIRNSLKKEHLISRNNYISLLNLIKTDNIHDPSHKNIMIEGVCHLHYPEQGIYKI